MLKYYTLVLFLFGLASGLSAQTEPVDLGQPVVQPDIPLFAQRGYSTMGSGTTGGQGGTFVTVTTGEELHDAIENKGNQPLMIFIDGVITPENSGGLAVIEIRDRNDISILGLGYGAEFDRIGIKIRSANNIIIRNLQIHNVRIGGGDCLAIEGPVSHVWIDHCELYNELDNVDKDYYDGLFDVKRDVDNLTFSWNYLHDAWKASLSGSSDGDDHNRTTTYHHNKFQKINSRLPLFRSGFGHVFNNLYENIGSSGINSRVSACVRVESNHFDNVNNPIISAYSAELGATQEIDNLMTEITWDLSGTDTNEPLDCVLEVPYGYTDVLNEPSTLQSLLSAYAGINVIHISLPGTPIEAEPEDCGGSTLDINANNIADGCEDCPYYTFKDAVHSYDASQDKGEFEVQEGGQTLYMAKNSWKAIEINYTVTPNTVLSFDFKSTIEGEIHELAFDNNLKLAAQNRFVIYGHQGYHGNFPIPKYDGTGDWQNFAIPLGEFFEGTFKYLIMTADDDSGRRGNAWYKHVRMYEDMDGDLACDLACIILTACEDGDPCTYGETYDVNCNCTGGSTLPDTDGDGICDDMDVCPNLNDTLIGQACDDGDACTDGEVYDDNCSCSGGIIVDEDQDGFCAAEDPDDKDGCLPVASESCINCNEIIEDFNSLLGIWNDGGTDCRRHNYAHVTPFDTKCIRLRDNSGVGSSLYSDALDLSSFEAVRVGFSFYPRSLEPGERFLLEVAADGVHFTELLAWVSGQDFSNDIVYDELVTVPVDLLGAATVIRFRCDASTNSDQVYLDDIKLELCGVVALENQDELLLASKGKQDDKVALSAGNSSVDLMYSRLSKFSNREASLSLYPNPVSDILNVVVEGAEIISEVEIYTVLGMLQQKITDVNGKKTQLDLSKLNGNESYYAKVTTEKRTSYIQKSNQDIAG